MPEPGAVATHERDAGGSTTDPWSGKIDCHSHVFPETYLELIARTRGELEARRVGGRWIVTYGDTQRFDIDPRRYDPELKLRQMGENGIAHAILSPNIPGPDLLHGDGAVDGARILNDVLAEHVAGAPNRFSALATLPWIRPDDALDELARVRSLQGFRGVMLHSNVAGRPVDAPGFEPVYEAIEAADLPIVLHPTVPTWGDPVRDYQMIPMMGLQVDTSFALLRLVLSGTLERHPGLRIVMPHAGGILPYMMGRIEHQTEVLGRGRERLSKPPRAYFDQVYLDSVTPTADTLAFALRFAGPDHVVFGTDHPWVEMDLMSRVAEQAATTDSEARAVAGGNARRLFRLPSVTWPSESVPAADNAVS